MTVDAADRRILECLQKDGRLQNIDLARKIGLSPSPCLRRVRQLEESGVIERYVALVNPVKVGMGLTLYVRVWLTGQDTDTVDHFISEVNALPQVVECYLMAGDCDFLLRIVTSDLDEYRNFRIPCSNTTGRDKKIRRVRISPTATVKKDSVARGKQKGNTACFTH
ncbi:Lrp/AsnC family transcriptional regulator [Oxalobacter paraformigenes]|uniref:HTH asnC-type domain-containing protein n=2 Tax=Oxalobacter paraformigenes TaxID=556268 RepID=C3X2K8_9BURK|nr:hypothetical protein OFAG_00597 [Oxalobacter paraformigenes]